MKLLSSLKSKAILMAGPISLSAMFSDPSAGASDDQPGGKGLHAVRDVVEHAVEDVGEVNRQCDDGLDGRRQRRADVLAEQR